jgi:hypothetical protein
VNQTLSPLLESLRPLADDINAQGAQIVMVNLMVKDEKGNILLNYLLDLQFGIENWWAADGINVDNWYPSIPASDLSTEIPPHFTTSPETLTALPLPTELPTETPSPTVTPAELPTETTTELPTETPAPTETPTP